MKTITFKSIALVLCLTFMFMVALPLAQAGWPWWKCAAGAVSCAAGMASAAALCANPATAAAVCYAATSAAISWCATVAANC